MAGSVGQLTQELKRVQHAAPLPLINIIVDGFHYGFTYQIRFVPFKPLVTA